MMNRGAAVSYILLTALAAALAAAVGISFKISSEGFSHAFATISRKGKVIRWESMPVKYAVCSLGTPDIKPNGDDGYGPPVPLIDIIHSAFSAWASVPGAKISAEYIGNGGCDPEGAEDQNTFLWVTDGWRDLPFHPPVAALAVTVTSFYPSKGKMASATVYFNNQYFHWGYVNSKEEEDGEVFVTDVGSVATHEIGHFLGAAHSSEDPWEDDKRLREATMYYASYPGDTSQRTLEEDDILLARYLYPEEDPGKPDVDSIEPAAAVGGYNGGSEEITIRGNNFADTVHVILAAQDKDMDDIHGHVFEIKDDYIKVRFNMAGTDPGTYDLVVGNSARSETRKKGAFLVAESEDEAEQFSSSVSLSSGGGGCGSVDPSQDTGGAFGALILLSAILVLRSKKMRPARGKTIRR